MTFFSTWYGNLFCLMTTLLLIYIYRQAAVLLPHYGENGRLDKVLTPYGYLQGGKFHTFLHDYQGNVAVVVVGDSVAQRNSYYPYGLPHATSSFMTNVTFTTPNTHKYSGKEFDTFGGTDLYDFHARYHAPSTGRFMTIDPMAEKYPGISPYMYCAGNPVLFVDPSGCVVTPHGDEAFDVIKMGLSKDEAQYVQLDSFGNIDASVMSEGLNTLGEVGGNYNALVTMVNKSDVVDVFASSTYNTSTGEHHMSEWTVDSFLESAYNAENPNMTIEEYAKEHPSYPTTKEVNGGELGVTIYGDEGLRGVSLNGNIQVTINNNYSGTNPQDMKLEMTKTFWHESGHVIFKMMGLPHSHGSIRSTVSNSPNNNLRLEKFIHQRTNEAEKNFYQHF